jgi:predicted DNA-binding WGR domain protein
MVTILPGSRPVYWENKVEDHNKFWAANLQEEKKDGKTVYTLIRRWGMIGTNGQRMEQSFENKYDAEKALDRLIWEKESKGYKPIF